MWAAVGGSVRTPQEFSFCRGKLNKFLCCGGESTSLYSFIIFCIGSVKQKKDSSEKTSRNRIKSDAVDHLEVKVSPINQLQIRVNKCSTKNTLCYICYRARTREEALDHSWIFKLHQLASFGLRFAASERCAFPPAVIWGGWAMKLLRHARDLLNVAMTQRRNESVIQENRCWCAGRRGAW